MESEIEEITKKLDEEVNLDQVDLGISNEQEIAIYQEARSRWVLDYHRLRTYAHLNEVVENDKLAGEQREQMKILVKQIVAIDKELKELQK